MTTRERARAKANTQQMAQYTELWIVGHPADVAALVHTASRSGLLAYVSPPASMGGDDPRIRRYLRLRAHRTR
ncbi:hypothetical protein [Plantactinospora sp. BB1]|uniref:hypothetical protein n=1 Tax=Plantactinospora sp. BB1 TaxID=2071627 RepID=UPI000D158780|nr:hypothetical protein [Plantactinospora sp. BB1]AVT38017.1 hypothetical protein C6W10_17985 [Plantactinospora sp. BB1]